MRNPYEVLGINERASDDEVKSAYRELARKYHPDRYKDNPLADLAAEKMKEINEAYDMITKQRKGGGQGGYSQTQSRGQQYGGGEYTGGDSGQFIRVRTLIESGNIAEAEQILRFIQTRNAEWYFLSGLVAMRRGWYNDAYKFFSTAHNMDPNNFEYRNALMQMQQQGGMYRGYGNQGMGAGGCSICDICAGLAIADCCCDCMGSGC